MTEKFISLRIRAVQAVEGRRDAGQGTLEYVGMIIVAAIVAVLVMTAIKGAGLDTSVGAKIKSIVDFS
jgi:hypothetical protein